MSEVKMPFGYDLVKNYFGQEVQTLKKLVAASVGNVSRTITSPMSFLRSATATHKRRLRVTASDLPAGSILVINHETAAACGLQLSVKTGFVKATVIGGRANQKGTGNWVCAFIYNGDGFIQISRDNLRLGYKSHPLVG